jgi:two-component system, OmpR family, sensor histidine kinase KdpD
LAAGQRQRAREALQREREAVVLYDVVRLMGEADLQEALQAVADRLRGELQLPALAIEIWSPSGDAVRVTAGDADTARLLQAGAGSAAHVLQGGASVLRHDHATPGRWVRIVQPGRSSRGGSPTQRDGVQLVPVRVGDRRVGALLLLNPGGADAFETIDDRLLSAAATQIGLAVERDRLHREAIEAEILRRTDQLRSALLNAVSHDLRTPLATIMASAGSLRQQDVDWTDEERQGFAEAIEEEAERLNRLVGNLLDLSRIEGGSLRPEKSWHDLATLVDDVLTRLRPVTSHHRIHVAVPDDLPVIWLDPVEIGQVLYNLVENAAKYAPAGSDISIEVRRAGTGIRIAVSDRGPGIPAAALPHLFDPFYRVIDRQPRPGGLGLGLAIVKGLVEAHGGEVRAENRAGGGARMELSLPIAGSADAPPAPETSVA